LRVMPVARLISAASAPNFATTTSRSSASSAAGPNTFGKCAGWILPTITFASVTASGPPLPVLVELCLPLVRVGGRLLAQKTRGEDPAAAAHAIELLGGEMSGVLAAPSVARAAGTVVVIDKARPSSQQYPRRPGVPARKPL